MTNTIDITMKARWKNVTIWSGTIDITMTNNTDTTLSNPEIKIQLGQDFNALQNTGFSFIQSGVFLTGTFSPWLSELASGSSVTFSIGASFPSGGNTQALPASYWVNDQLTDAAPPSSDTTKPSAPRNLRVRSTSASSLSLGWDESAADEGVASYSVRYTNDGVNKVLNVGTTSCTIDNLMAGTTYNCSVRAKDTSNSYSDWSAPLLVTLPSLLPSMSVPFAPYIDVTINADWNTVPPRMNTRYIIDALDIGVRVFHLAFLVLDTTTNQLVWGNSSFPYTSVRPLCDIIHQAGGEVVAAFGGAAGADPSVSLSIETLTSTYLGLKNDFGITRIDFDFETPGMYNYSQAFRAARNALDASSDLSFSLTLPVATTGLTQEGINMLMFARQVDLPLTVQIMAMDYGTPGVDMGEAAISAIEGTRVGLASIYPDKTSDELYAMIAVIPMLGQNDSPGEMFTFQDAIRTAQYARQKGLSLVSEWSLARDFPCMGDLSTCSRNPEQTLDYEYTQTFLNTLE